MQTLRFLLRRDRHAVLRFLRASYPMCSLPTRLGVLRRWIRISNALRGYHTMAELLQVSDRILIRAGQPDLRVVECGAGSGASTAKLSLVCAVAGAELHVFDTFRGIPENREQHRLLDGTPIRFKKGAFRGRLGAVQRRVEEFGEPSVCTFHKGLFAETLPPWNEAVDVGLLDVDLIASTETCIKELFPLLRTGGCLFSQDGHLQATRRLLEDEHFWRDTVGHAPPPIRSPKDRKLITIEATSARAI
ncbi:MAG: TylF/MycF/NovP-related O-methyltransferase [Myxococcota bacterium]